MDRCIEKARKKNQQPSLYPPKSERLNRITHRDENRLGLFLARNAEKLGLRVYLFVSKYWLGIISFHLFLFILGSISAPCLSYLGEEEISKYIYGFYGISCHQISSRSFFIFNHKIAICARCFSFYASMLIFGLLLSLKNVRPLNRKTALFLALPIIADVLLQTLGIKESTNLLRVTTALLLSLSISFYIYPRIHLNRQPYGHTHLDQTGLR
ncbi:MAG: DUF2085 domain-containing protein [candidate division Zixibacteria bacterium]|nr:DUF2085 domain-containing protein [candidate division Zixibacteria bacterium]